MSDLRHELRARIAGLGLRPEREAEIVEELAQHLDDRVRELVAGGASPDAARGDALADLAAPGDLARRLAEIETRPPLLLPPPGAPARGRWLQRRWTDARQAARALRRTPGFAAAVVATLAFTIGPTTAMLSIGNWLLWRPTPGVTEARQLGVVWFGEWIESAGSVGVSIGGGVSALNQRDLVRASETIAAMAGIQEGDVNLAAPGLPAAVTAAGWVTSDLFDVLGVRVSAGRGFTADEDRPPFGAPVVVVSDGLARRALGGPDSALGREIQLNGRPLTVIGVLPPEFAGMTPFSRVDVWFTGATYRYVNHFRRPGTDARETGLFHSFVVRLAPGATFASAQTELDVLVPALAVDHPVENKSFERVRARVFEGLGPRVLERDRYRRLVGILVAIGVALLLVGCANVANLMILRAIRMARDQAIRLSLGASRAALAAFRLTEGALLSLAGGAAGVLLAIWLKQFMVTLILPDAGSTGSVSVPLDRRVLAATLAASLVCGVAAGLVPAMMDAFRRAPLAGAAGHGRATTGARRTRTGFAVAQLALSLALVTGSLLLVATLRHLRSTDLGFEPRGVSIHALDPTGQGYSSDRASLYIADVYRRVAGASGPGAVALSYRSPFGPGRLVDLRDPSGPEDARVSVYSNAVSAEYFDVLGIRLVRGRSFTSEEALGPSTGLMTPVIVSQQLARRLFGEADPLGRPLTPADRIGPPGQVLTVIGISADARWNSLTGDPELFMYLPFAAPDTGGRNAELLVRSSLPFRDVMAIVHRAAAEVDPTLPVQRSEALSSRIDHDMADQRLFAWVLSMLGWLGFVLAAVGLFGLLAQSVTERRREFGIRIAIGSGRRNILGLVLRQAIWIGVLGTAAGLGLAAVGSRLIAAQLSGVTALEPAIYAGSAGALALVVLAAGFWPAWTATRIDPVEALRAD